MSPTLAAQMAATYQRVSGGRLLLNVVTGGDDIEQRRFGDHLGKRGRYARAGEFLHIVRELWERGARRLRRRALRRARRPDHPRAGRGRRSTSAARRRTRSRWPRRYADVYLTWGEPPAAVAEKLDRVRERGRGAPGASCASASGCT